MGKESKRTTTRVKTVERSSTFKAGFSGAEREARRKRFAPSRVVGGRFKAGFLVVGDIGEEVKPCRGLHKVNCADEAGEVGAEPGIGDDEAYHLLRRGFVIDDLVESRGDYDAVQADGVGEIVGGDDGTGDDDYVGFGDGLCAYPRFKVRPDAAVEDGELRRHVRHKERLRHSRRRPSEVGGGGEVSPVVA